MSDTLAAMFDTRPAAPAARRRPATHGVWFPHAAGNPYQALMMRAAPIPMRAVSGLTGLRGLLAETPGLLHLHWDEWFLRDAPDGSDMAAALVAETLLTQLSDAGWRILWTCHNLLPHELRSAAHRQAFCHLRRAIVALAEVIHVHCDRAAADLVASHGADPARIVTVAHPSYPATPGAPRNGLGDPVRFLSFGMLRAYKQHHLIVAAMDRLAQAGTAAHLHIAGPGPAGRLAGVPDRADITTTRRRIPEGEVAALFAAADFAVIHHRNALTSGAAMLALSHGVPVIGPRTPDVLADMPAAPHGIAFDPDAANGLADAMSQAVALSETAYAAMRRASRALADRLRPEHQSATLIDALAAHRLIGAPNARRITQGEHRPWYN